MQRNGKRQDYLRTALMWVSKGNIDDYMSRHRFDTNITGSSLKCICRHKKSASEETLNRLIPQVEG